MIRRRDLFLMPAVGMVRVPLSARGVKRVVLNGPEPLMELARVWCYGSVRRVMVRPEGAWWPSAVTLPDRWQAWMELDRGGAVHVVAQGASTHRPEHTVASDVVRLLSVQT